MSPRISTVLYQWCAWCQKSTRSVPCDVCGPPDAACADCGRHPGHDDEEIA